MKKIEQHKLAPPFVMHLPMDAKFLSVQFVAGSVLMYFEVDDAMPKIKRTFSVIGTDKEIPEGATFLSTLLIHEVTSVAVMHIYEDSKTVLHA